MTPRRPADPEPTDLTAEPPVVGVPTSVQAVQPSAVQRRADAKGRVGNTFTQVGVPASLLTVAVYLTGFWHLDLDPIGKGTDIPTLVNNSLLVLLTWLLCRRMNRDGLNATDDDPAE